MGLCSPFTLVGIGVAGDLERVVVAVVLGDVVEHEGYRQPDQSE